MGEVKTKIKAKGKVQFKVVDKNGNLKYTGGTDKPLIDHRENKSDKE